MTFQQDERLIGMLLSMQRCPNFGVCDEAVYDPVNGHVPRGFSGATARLEDVYLVMVFAEPGFPLPGESYTGDPQADLRFLLNASYLRSGANQFHRNITAFLDSVFPFLAGDIDQQLKHVWLTESRHCSIAEEIGTIKKPDRVICSRTHLVEQIKLFPNAIVLLAGGKAAQVGSLLNSFITCGAFALPGCNQKEVRERQKAVAEECKAYLEMMMSRS